jgi:RimJ/RimL family protein N-acetyltransferase
MLVMEKEIATGRLVLRGLRPADAGPLELHASDPRVARMTTTIPHPFPHGHAEAFIRRALSGQTGEHVWAIAMGPEGHGGFMGLVRLRPTAGHGGEITYWVAPAFWGTGYASEAVRAICEAAPDWGIEAVTARVFQDNEAAKRVLLRNGFAFIGPGEAHSVARNAIVPTFDYKKECRGG